MTSVLSMMCRVGVCLLLAVVVGEARVNSKSKEDVVRPCRASINGSDRLTVM